MDYQIYKICPKVEHEEGDVYYGYTHKSNRFYSHQVDYDRWFMSKERPYTSSYKVFMRYGFDNCEYVVLEEGIKTKQEAMEREKYYIQSFPCVNKHHSKRDTEIDISKIKERKKREPKLELTTAQLKYRNDTDHKEKMKALSKQHKETHPELYKKHTCACGATHMVKNIGIHLTSVRHKYFLETGTQKNLL